MGSPAIEEDALSAQVGRVMDLEAGGHLLSRADVAPTDDREALLVELLGDVVFDRVARGVDPVPAREETGQGKRKTSFTPV